MTDLAQLRDDGPVFCEQCGALVDPEERTTDCPAEADPEPGTLVHADVDADDLLEELEAVDDDDDLPEGWSA